MLQKVPIVPSDGPISKVREVNWTAGFSFTSQVNFLLILMFSPNIKMLRFALEYHLFWIVVSILKYVQLTILSII
jgi:hypothetical protein